MSSLKSFRRSFRRFSIWRPWRRYILVLGLSSLAAPLLFNQMPAAPITSHCHVDTWNPEGARPSPTNTLFSPLNPKLQLVGKFQKEVDEAQEVRGVQKSPGADVAPVRLDLKALEKNGESWEEDDFKGIAKDHKHNGARRSDFNEEVGDAAEKSWQEREVEYQRRNERIRQVCQKRNFQITSPPVITHHNFSSIKSTPGIDEGNSSLNMIKPSA